LSRKVADTGTCTAHMLQRERGRTPLQTHSSSSDTLLRPLPGPPRTPPATPAPLLDSRAPSFHTHARLQPPPSGESGARLFCFWVASKGFDARFRQLPATRHLPSPFDHTLGRGACSRVCHTTAVSSSPPASPPASPTRPPGAVLALLVSLCCSSAAALRSLLTPDTRGHTQTRTCWHLAVQHGRASHRVAD
jgi:hypothetical protein